MKYIKIRIFLILLIGTINNKIVGSASHIKTIQNQITNSVKHNSQYFDTLPENSNFKIIALAKAYEDSIVLRLAPPYFVFWESVRQNGFIIKKGTSKDNLIEVARVFPSPKETMKSNIYLNDSTAQVAFQLLYGSIDKSSLKGYKLYEANENILGMAMLISEFSKEAANILGFRFVDRDVSKGQKYIYEISSLEYPDKKHTVLIEVVNNLTTPVKPAAFQVLTGDNSLKLEWSKDVNQNNFTYYKIERSTDDINYLPVTRSPLFFNRTNDSLSNKFIYTDSLDIINDKKYFYRLYGGNSFAEYSPPATASGTPKDLTPPKSPEINKVEYSVDLNEFNIEWDIDITSVEADFAYYQVMVARGENENYNALSPQLGLSDFYYTHNLGPERKEENEGRYYFRIDCYDEEGNRSQSIQQTSFVPDFTDPQAPDSLYGFLDSLSIVHLSWKKSVSKDVRGYWLYWGNSLNEELALVSKDILKDTSYRYYIPDKSLNKRIYYVVRAEDFAYNRSETSNVAEVKRLDMIPPIRPSIKSINTDSIFMKINLTLSPSEDVHYYELYRSSSTGKDTNWILLDTLWGESKVSDNSAIINMGYLYKVRAVDSTGNISLFSPVKTGTIKANANLSKITAFTVKNVSKSNKTELVWTVDIHKKLRTEPFVIEVWRSTGQGGVTPYKTLAAGLSSMADENITPGVLYNYAVRVKYDNGWTGELSEVKSILIK